MSSRAPVPRGGPAAPRAAVLCGVFLLSGASALVFETLWFRQAGLTFGNGVWASALVLSSFMAGLALGNGLAARFGARVRRPARVYAWMELAVAAAGIALVVGLPLLTEVLAPLFRPLQDRPLLLNALRLSLSFLLLMVPATAMGTTLPLLVKALFQDDSSFGSVLGRLYGWNTLGAVVGALAGEVVLLERLGVVGTALAAGLCNLVAAALAVTVAGGTRAPEPRPPTRPPRVPLDGRTRRALLATSLAGGVLLAFEVAWFRFLQLFLQGTSLTFAAMLAVVLAGIGLGGLGAAVLLRRAPGAARHAPAFALAAGVLALGAYRVFGLALGSDARVVVEGYGLDALPLAVPLMLPVSIASGCLFAVVGQVVHASALDETRAAGLVTMANTIGAALGPLLAGFLLLPWLGMERTFLALGLAYAAVAALLLDASGARRPSTLALAAALGLAAALFPLGRMRAYLDVATAGYRVDGSEVIASHEGRTETLQYLRKDFLGRPDYYRLVTNSYSMAGTHEVARRYMKAYVWLPVALQEDPGAALLISFGTGSTAQALVDSDAYDPIVVVDVSREILELADHVFPVPGSNPLDDPRVETRVEDGRFFLETTERRFDLITSEPPPPKMAGVVNLYTRDYFDLVRGRLTEGGICTYWLPVTQFEERETLAILRAFLDVFGPETTLWTGCGFDWMLVGSRGPLPAVSTERFARQWRDPDVRPELEALGFPTPAMLAATFLAGAEDLEELTRDVEPLTDRFPKRLSSWIGTTPASRAFHRGLMDTRATRERFERSAWVRSTLPADLRERTLAEAFVPQRLLNRVTIPSGSTELDLPLLHQLLVHTELEAPVRWLLGTTSGQRDVLAELGPEEHADSWRPSFVRGLNALAERRLDEAARELERSDRMRPDERVALLRVYVLALAGRADEARALVEERADWFRGTRSGRSVLGWLEETLGVAL